MLYHIHPSMSDNNLASLPSQDYQSDDQQGNQNNQNNHMNESRNALMLSIILIWTLSGILAFIFSIVCFWRTGTPVEKVIGLLIAILMGPFYFLYFLLMKDYCK
jgi:uncharacterized membrane-anchored protein